MSWGLTTRQYYEDIAEAIRVRGRTDERLLPREMAAAIHAIPTNLSELITVVTSEDDLDGFSASSECTAMGERSNRRYVSVLNTDSLPLTYTTQVIKE